MLRLAKQVSLVKFYHSSLLYRFLFWTEDGWVKRLNLAAGVQKTRYVDTKSFAIKLDYTKKRVYLLTSRKQIFSSGYDGENVSFITNGSLNRYSLGVFGDSLFYQNTDLYHIKEMNVSNGKISRSILVDKVSYYDLIFVDNSIQPIGELE